MRLRPSRRMRRAPQVSLRSIVAWRRAFAALWLGSPSSGGPFKERTLLGHPRLVRRWRQAWPHRVLIEAICANAPTLLWLCGASLVSLCLHWAFFALPMISDEGGYAYVAQRWLDGRGTLYGDLWVSRPQGIFLAYGAIFHTIGTSVGALRFGAWLFSVATLLLIWRYASLWKGRNVAR